MLWQELPLFDSGAQCHSTTLTLEQCIYCKAPPVAYS